MTVDKSANHYKAILTKLASKMMLTPAQAVALPTAITCAAGKVGMPESSFISECMRISELSEYVASVCRSVTRDS